MSLSLELLAAALLPVLVILWYVRHRDAFREPPRVVMATFLLGMVTVTPLLAAWFFIGRVLSDFSDPFVFAAAAAFLEAAIPEEALKFLVLYFYAARHDAFDEPMDGIVYGVAASLGFAGLENILYVSDGGWQVAIARALTAVPAHALDGVLMGFYVGLAHVMPARRSEFLAKALAVPILFHGLYDLPLMLLNRNEMAARGTEYLADQPWALAAIAVLVVEAVVARHLYRRFRLMQDRQVARQTVA
ncbi:MAG: PrsW family intramembrane metalloprotease [Alphaproteobacteria bacterium]|nr:PrsW family intramembrane metalloprotease [Alphaproteobacteria bacterium]